MSGTQRRWRYGGRKSAVGVLVALLVAGLVAADRMGAFGRLSDNQAGEQAVSYADDWTKYDGKTFTVVKAIDGDTFDIDIPDTYQPPAGPASGAGSGGAGSSGGTGVRVRQAPRVSNGDWAQQRKPYRYKTTRVRLWGVDTPETRMPHRPVMHFGPQASAFTRQAVLNQKVRVQLERGQDPRDRTDGKRLLAWVYLQDGRLLNEVLVAEGYAYADPRFKHRLRARMADLQAAALREGKGLWRNGPPADMPGYYATGKHPCRASIRHLVIK